MEVVYLGTLFSTFASICRSLESTPGRIDKRHIIANFLKSLLLEEIPPAISFLLGQPFPESDERVLELGGATIWKLPPTRQTTLVSEPLTISDVAKCFDAIASASGVGSRAKKEALIQGLLGRASSVEITYIFRILAGEMRIGAVEGVVMDAIAEASGLELETIQRANMLRGNLGEVAKLALSNSDILLTVGLRLFTPIKPMLAEMSYDLEEVFAEHGGMTAFEWKFDGARIQIHKKGDNVKIFSRRLSEITSSLPELVEEARTAIHAQDALVEGEAIALGEDGKPLPFQDLMRRFRRVKEVGKAQKMIPLRLYLFDILYKDGVELIDKPYGERWRVLGNTATPHILAPRIVTNSVDEVKRFLNSAIDAGHEGLMAKALDSPYSIGVRGISWFKIKPFETLDLVIIAAEWGYGRREGWLSNYHLAARDETTGGFVMLGKTFKGLTDREFESITKNLLDTKTGEEGNTIIVRPTIVVEVAYNELQKSPRYSGGLALRFARIIRIRYDKSPEEADTIERVRDLFQKKFARKGILSRNSTPD
jgi:DNA ligase-1